MAPAKAKVAKKKTAAKEKKKTAAKVAKKKTTAKVAKKTTTAKTKPAKTKAKAKTTTTKATAKPQNKLVVRKAIPPPRQLTPKDSVIDLTEYEQQSIPEPQHDIHQMADLKELMKAYNISGVPKKCSVKIKADHKIRKSKVSVILTKTKTTQYTLTF